MRNTWDRRKQKRRSNQNPLTHVHAATIPVGGVTAWRGLFDTAEKRPEGIDLWRSGRSGQLCRSTCEVERSPCDWDSFHPKSTVSAAIGVDEAFDYEKAQFEVVVRDVDVVLDPIAVTLRSVRGRC